MQLPDNEIFKPEPPESLTPDGKNTNLNTEMTDVELERNVSAVVEELTQVMQNKKISHWCREEGKQTLAYREEMEEIASQSPRHRDYHLFFFWHSEKNVMMMNIGRDNSKEIDYFVLANGQIENTWRSKKAVTIINNEVLRYLVKTCILTPEIIKKFVSLKERTNPINRRTDPENLAVIFRDNLTEATKELKRKHYILIDNLDEHKSKLHGIYADKKRPGVVAVLLMKIDQLRAAFGNLQEKLQTADLLELYEIPDSELSIHAQNTISNPIVLMIEAKQQLRDSRVLLQSVETDLKVIINKGLELFSQDLWLLADDGLNEVSGLSTVISVIEEIETKEKNGEHTMYDREQTLAGFAIIKELARYRPPEIIVSVEQELNRLVQVRKVLSNDRYERIEFLIEWFSELELLHVHLFAKSESLMIRTIMHWLQQLMDTNDKKTAEGILQNLPERFGFKDKVTKLIDEKFANAENKVSLKGLARINLNQVLAPFKDALTQRPLRRRLPPTSDRLYK